MNCRVCGSKKELIKNVGATKIIVCAVCGFFKRVYGKKKK